MSNELRFPTNERDAELGAALEPLLVPPTNDAAYWNGLQSRIMARVANAASPATWWLVSPAVARAGVLAAAVALLVLGALALQNRELENRLAFDAVTETELEVARIIPGIDAPDGPRASGTAPAAR